MIQSLWISRLHCSTYGQSASCTHISALLHALSAVNPRVPTIPHISDSAVEDEIPCTSLPCQWKPPRKRKESTLRISDATFEKHDYAKPVKRKISPVENFDPRPEKFRGVASSRLPELLQKLKGEQPCISLLFDEHFQVASSSQPNDKNLPSISGLKDTIQEFKSSLEVTQQMSREIERNTREQQKSALWFSVRRHRLTASLFGAVLAHKPSTPPDSLVLHIIQPKNFSTPATTYGINMEKQENGCQDMIVSASGVIVNPKYSFLGASPDVAVYKPQIFNSHMEVKCPYSARNLTPVEACRISGFCCNVNSSGQLELKKTHHYYTQVQGQMALGERPWCDFVVYTPLGTSVEVIQFNESYWENELLPKLTTS